MKRFILMLSISMLLIPSCIFAAEKNHTKTVTGYVLDVGPGNRGQDVYAVGSNKNNLELDSSILTNKVRQCLSEALSERYKAQVSVKIKANGELDYKTMSCKHIDPR